AASRPDRARVAEHRLAARQPVRVLGERQAQQPLGQVLPVLAGDPEQRPGGLDRGDHDAPPRQPARMRSQRSLRRRSTRSRSAGVGGAAGGAGAAGGRGAGSPPGGSAGPPDTLLYAGTELAPLSPPPSPFPGGVKTGS